MTCSGSNSEEVEFQPSQTAAPLLPNIHYFYYSAIMLLNLLLLTIHYFGVHCRRVPATAAKLLWNAAIRLQQWLAGRQTDNFSKIERKETGRHVSKSNLTHIQGELWSTVSGHWGQLMQNRMCWQYNRGRMCRQCGKGRMQCCRRLIVGSSLLSLLAGSPAYRSSTPIDFTSSDSDQFLYQMLLLHCALLHN